MGDVCMAVIRISPRFIARGLAMLRVALLAGLTLVATFGLTACGYKGDLTYPALGTAPPSASAMFLPHAA